MRRNRLAAPAQLVGRIDTDAASTGTIQVEAAWDEIDDNPLHPRYVLQAGRCVSVPRSLVFREYAAPPAGAGVLATAHGVDAAEISENIGQQCAENKVFLGGEKPATTAGPASTDCSLPLPDARRRRINCVASAKGRYADHYRDAPADKTQARSRPVIGDVPASMALSVPQISHILPIVRQLEKRDGGARERRRIYGFRIYVQRPWFLSGVGERLAIGCHTGQPPAGAHPTLNKLFTQWGEDPMQRMGLASTRHLPRADDFRVAAGTDAAALDPALYPPDSPEGAGHILYLDDVVRDETVPPSGDDRMALASLALRWDDAERLWFCDVEVAEPFAGWIGLALYRHQPHAHEGLQLSLSPRWVYSKVIEDEQVTWVRQGDRVHITIGPVFDKALNFEVETRRFRDGVSEALSGGDPQRQALGAFSVGNRTYFEGYFDVPSSDLRVVRRRFNAEISAFTLEGPC